MTNHHHKVIDIATRKPLEPPPVIREGLALSNQACSQCFGLGKVPTRKGGSRACNCVLRGIFDLCYRRWQDKVNAPRYVNSSSLHAVAVRHKIKVRNEEYVADFELVAYRALNDGATRLQMAEADREESPAWKLFKFHFLLGADWKLCCRKLGIDRGAFFHQVYRIKEMLGRAFVNLQPYPLYPTDAYVASFRKPVGVCEPKSIARKRFDALFRLQAAA